MDDNDNLTAIAVFVTCNFYLICHIVYRFVISHDEIPVEYRAYRFSEHLIFALLISGLAYIAFYMAYENVPEATNFYHATINWSLVNQLAAYWIVVQFFIVSSFLCILIWGVFLSAFFDSTSTNNWFFGLLSIGITILSTALFFLLTYFWNAYPDAF